MHLLESPDRVVDLPPIRTRIPELPLDQLTWQNFERLLYRLARKNFDVEYCATYGRPGQSQGGIDVYGRLTRGRYVCWQAKNRKILTASSIMQAVDDFLGGSWAESCDRFLFCCTSSLADTTLQNAIEAEATRLRQKNIVFEALDGVQLSELLRPHPDIIDDYFGRQWLTAFAGEDVAASLRRPLDAQRVIALREHLAQIYDARFRQLDPALTLDPGALVTRDIRKRFVAPNVDPDNPFIEPSVESEDWPSDLGEQDDSSWEFDDDQESGQPSLPVRPPSEPTETPYLPLEDWLLQADRSYLLLGAPGSGKSTVLRCLALDLLQKPKLFPRIAERLGSCIPLLIPFALWSRIATKLDREVGLPDVIRATFGALIPPSELQDSLFEALLDERLLLLIDGLDEYTNEQAARTTLATIESFVRTNNIATIMTARPAGFRRLGSITDYWEVARLTELSPLQQRDLATKLLTEQDNQVTPIALRVDQFFQQLDRTGRLQPLAGNPLLLHGLLSVASRQIILPRTRFQLFQQLIKVLLDVQPTRRATAASEVQPRTQVFSTDDLRRVALARLAFNIQQRGADTGIDRSQARSIIENFLHDSSEGPGWSKENARLGAGELTNIDADTSGLLVERGPREIAFCHAAFREHLAGIELQSWPLDRQVAFASTHADEPRWRSAILTLFQSLDRRTDVERILQAILDKDSVSASSIDRRILLADCAFATASRSGTVGRQIAFTALDRIESGMHDAERFEVLGLALDGPRAGPIGEEIVSRLGKWWPGVTRLQHPLYKQLGNWPQSEELARTLLLAIQADRSQLAAAASLAKAFKGNTDVGEQLTKLARRSLNPWVTAAALDALSKGWPITHGLDDWLRQAELSPSIQLRTVAALALYRRGRRGNEARDALLRALAAGLNRFSVGQQHETIEALVTHWADDSVLQDACWASINKLDSPKFNIGYRHAQTVLLRIHKKDSRIPAWIATEIESSDQFPFIGPRTNFALLEPILSEYPIVRAAVEAWFSEEKFSDYDFYASQLAAIHRSTAAKQCILNQLKKSTKFIFWPVRSLLEGWGMEDPEVADVLQPLARTSPEHRQYLAHHIPTIIESNQESLRLLTEICELSKISRPDFVFKGFAALGNDIDDSKAVSAFLPHIPMRQGIYSHVGPLITRFYADPRVREFVIKRLHERSPPLTQIASVYSGDSEIASLILRRAAPLPTKFRRYIAKRATQRFDDPALRTVLQQCDLETDDHAQAQATIGLSYAALSTTADPEELLRHLNEQLHVIEIDLNERRVAAFGGLLALGRIDIFGGARDRFKDEPLKVGLISTRNDYAPVLGLAAERWAELEDAVGPSFVERLSKRGNSPSSFWHSMAPYLSRSSRLCSRFIDYCNDSRAMLRAPALLTLAQLRPGSSLLLDCCIRILTNEFDRKNFSLLDAARSTMVASKCLAAKFSQDTSAVTAIVDASDKLRANGAALVGLASRWPDHEITIREYRNLLELEHRSVLIWCARLWLHSTKGSNESFMNAFAQFVTRDTASPWDFPQDALGAIRARLERDPATRDSLQQLAMADDEPSIRASAVRLLATVLPKQSRQLANDLLTLETQRPGPPRFALDIITNRVRPAEQLIREVLSEPNA